MNQKELFDEILKHKVISFDIFDTLITRIVDNPESRREPDDVLPAL